MDQQPVRQALEDSYRRRREMAAQIRRRGRVDYVLRYGVLRIGVGVAMLVWLLLMLAAPTRDMRPLGTDVAPAWAQWLLVSLLVGAAAGVVWGFWIWGVYERRWFPLLDGESRSE